MKCFATRSTASRPTGRFDEQHVGAGFAIALAALQRRFEAFDRDRVAARDDHEVAIGARVARRFDFRDHLGGRNDALAGEMSAALGPRLVFEMHARDAGSFVVAYGAAHVDRIAVAGVRVGDDRKPDASTIRLALSTISVAVSSPTSGSPRRVETRAEARHVNRVEAFERDEPRGERVGDAGRDDAAGIARSGREGARWDVESWDVPRSEVGGDYKGCVYASSIFQTPSRSSTKRSGTAFVTGVSVSSISSVRHSTRKTPECTTMRGNSASMRENPVSTRRVNSSIVSAPRGVRPRMRIARGLPSSSPQWRSAISRMKVTGSFSACLRVPGVESSRNAAATEKPAT